MSNRKPTGYAGGGGGREKGFSGSKCNYTKKLQCAKLNVRLATVHKRSTQEDVLMKNQENDTFSLAQGKYNKGKSPRTINAHDEEMSIPYCIHAEISQKSDMRSIADRDRENPAGVM